MRHPEEGRKKKTHKLPKTVHCTSHCVHCNNTHKANYSSLKILNLEVAEGPIVSSDGECEITFKICPATFTFSFLVSNALTQDIILGYNFKKTFHIGTDWNRNDEMYLKMNGQYLTTILSTKRHKFLSSMCRISYNSTKV